MAAVVKLRGLPWSVTEYQIVDFFRPIPVGVESITLINNAEGRASGEGYVWIHQNNMAQALSYNRGCIGSRYIEVFPSTEEEYTHAVQQGGGAPGQYTRGGGIGAPRQIPPQTANDCVIRVRGLPFSATPQDLVVLFTDYGLDESNVYMGVSPGGAHAGSANGDAFLRFATVDVAQKVLANMQGSMLGRRYMELFAATEAEIEAKANVGALQGFEGNQGSGGGDLNPQEYRPGSGWVKLRGLPYNTTQQEIADFMIEYGVPEIDVTIKYGADGRPSGEAYVQVDSEQTAYAARSALDRKYVGERFVEVFVSSFEESQSTRTNERFGPYNKGSKGGYGGYGSYGGYGGGYGGGKGGGKSYGKGKW